MNRGWLVILAGCLILGFQNCSQSSLSQTDFPSSASTQLVSPSVGSGAEASEAADISSIEIPVSEGTLSVDAESGRISLIGRNQQVVEESCLQSAEVAELQSYLKSSSICGSSPVDSDAVCAQTYTAGYVTLIMGDQRMNLGESYDSCGRGFKDLCGDQAQSFRGLVSYIQKNFHGLLCE